MLLVILLPTICWHLSVPQTLEIYWLIQAQRKLKWGWLSQFFLPGCYNKDKFCKRLMFGEWMKLYCLQPEVSLFNLLISICKISGTSYWLFHLKVGPQSLVILFLKTQRKLHCGKVSKYRVFSDSYFPVFGLNTDIYGVQSECRKRQTRKNCVFGLFSWSVRKSLYSVQIQEEIDQKKTHIWTLFTQC